MKNNRIQFAVVREDPEIILPYIKKLNIKKILMIGSGGCTALSYKSEINKINIDLLDMNENQLNLINLKSKLVLNVGTDLSKESFKNLMNIENSSLGYNNNGNFESLFKQLMSFVFEFVITENELKNFLIYNIKDDQRILKEIFENKYWEIAFKLFFSDDILIGMFGNDAVQHAEKNSYPKYFQNVIEEALRDKERRSSNYFLHHFLFNSYISEKHIPLYLKNVLNKGLYNVSLNYINGTFKEVKDISKYEMIDLSNIFDWMCIEDVKSIIKELKTNMKSGSIIIFRQINNYKDIISLFGDEFDFNEEICNDLKINSRSMFYNKINLGTKK